MIHENEVKFVCKGYAELEHRLTPRGWHDITQGYLNPGNRVRRITYANGQDSYFFTFKQRMTNGHNLEIEAPISAEVFFSAWPHTIERLSKRRISIEHGNVKWDIDFYRWREPYFVLAEAELPIDVERPEVILPELQDYVVYEVSREDGRFAARRLADEDHVRRVAQELGL
jgi:CYTH domain-containing protein